MEPTRSPAPFLDHAVRERYRPERAAQAWAAASMARESCPVAWATAIIPFITPLLWVTARYTSLSANSYASTMSRTVSSPSISAGKTADAEATLPVE